MQFSNISCFLTWNVLFSQRSMAKLYDKAVIIRLPFKTVMLLMLILASRQLQAQLLYPNGYNSFHIYSRFTSFPDTGRKYGYTSEGKFYTFKGHYNDSSVLIITPKNLRADEKVDLIFWFHGWGNNIDSAAIRYELTKQFIASGRNGVLVLAETARNAPDSYAGKLNRPGDFKLLVADVLKGLKKQKLIGENCIAGNILLGGHSGAYGAIAAILKFGEMPINEVILFDALYSKTEVFLGWIKADTTHRFVHLYTDKGYGPLEESKTTYCFAYRKQIKLF